MNMSDLKLYLINGLTLAMSFAHIDMVLKIILLSASIGYTIQRWYLLDKERREGNSKKK
jgi:hypothetical protein